MESKNNNHFPSSKIKGPGYSAENTIAGTELALNEGVNVEVDVWGDSKGKPALVTINLGYCFY